MSIAIIGGGASGMILASKLKNCDVTLFEKNNKLGKKLLITGNGKCNFTNDDFSNINKIYNNNFAISIYKRFDNNSFIEFMKSIGVYPKIEIHKKISYYYPNSNKSTSVYYNLLDKIIENKVKILTDTNIINIKKENNIFLLEDEKGNKFKFDKVVISTGGKTYSKTTGSDGSGYELALKLKHNIIEPIPALCGLIYKDNDLKNLKGVRIDAIIYAYNDNFFVKESGEVQFTEYSISGIPIMNLSRIINRNIYEGKNICLYLNFSNFDGNDYILDLQLLKNELNQRKIDLSYKNVKDFLCGFIPDELANIILLKSNINIKNNNKVNQLSEQNIIDIANNILRFKIDINSFENFDRAQITLGGIDTNCVNINNLESKLFSGLYFTGEVIDIDGKCGGYNLQLAYSSASVVAKDLLKGNGK